jgi:hypothetical protein
MLRLPQVQNKEIRKLNEKNIHSDGCPGPVCLQRQT